MQERIDELVATLGQWLVKPHEARFCAVGQGSSFSGAGIWRVEHGAGVYVLRRWPNIDVAKIDRIVQLQKCLTAANVPVPCPLPLQDRAEKFVLTQMKADGTVAIWTLSRWMPGVADYSLDPRPAKLKAGLAMLATIHLSANALVVADAAGPPRSDRSPALIARGERLQALQRGDLAELKTCLSKAPPSLARELAFKATALADRALHRLGIEAHRWRDERLPLQWVLRDVWHDHVLFTEDRVTGVIDFGAAAVDSPAGDVARLLGSLVGDDEAGWRVGMEAYGAQRPLSPAEVSAVRYFDATGTLLSAMNWVHWLFRDASGLGETVELPVALKRLERLTTRLQCLNGVW